MDCKGYVTIQSKVQGPLRGHDKHKDGWVEVLAFSYEVTAPRDISTGQASGKRQHQPVVITKEWGAATPQLFQALWSNEVLTSVAIQFVDPNGKSPKKNPHRIHLTNAVVSQINHIGGGKYSVTFDYEKIAVSFGLQPNLVVIDFCDKDAPAPLP
jgi:type VI secretion system Hcp family effector